MHKFSLALLLSLCSLCAAAQERTLLQKTADTICTCMGREKIRDTADAEAMKALFMNCFTTAAMTNVMLLAEERGIDLTDRRAGEVLCAEIGRELLKRNCKPFIAFSLASAKKNMTDEEEPAVQELEGTLVRVDTKDFRYLIVKDASGREQSFIWLDYFEGSDTFIGDKVKPLIGKKIAVEWKDREVYLPSAGNYFRIKQIAGITLIKK